MRADKLREMFSKIDTDPAMDQRIKARLLRQMTEEQERYAQKSDYESCEEYHTRYSGSRVSMARVLATVVMSVFVIMLSAVLLYGLKEAIKHFDEPWRKQAVTENTNNLPATGDSTLIPGGDESADTDPVDNNANKNDPDDSVPVNNGPDDENPFYFAQFDANVDPSGVIKTIPHLVIRLHGKTSTINPADLTDVVLYRDDKVIENRVEYTGVYESFLWGDEVITDFYFAFEDKNEEPGRYKLTGKYKGIAFEVAEKIVERPISDVPAAAEDIMEVTFSYYRDPNGNVTEISELVFSFRGHQNTFYKSDLADLKCFRDGEEISFRLQDRVIRYYDFFGSDSADTSYHIVFIDKFTEPGRYKVTGKYRGVSFESDELVIP